MLDLVRSWGGRGVVVRHDGPTGAWVFVALHDDTLGRPTGGCRMRAYERPEDGLADALRLAEGMTSKWAVLDLPFGGGKSVLALDRPLREDERNGLLDRFAALLESLGGAYATGEDMGTTPEDMARLAATTRWVHGAPDPRGGPVDPGPFTAAGVLAGMEAALEHRTGSPALEGRTVLVQGAGDVGRPLALGVTERGGSVIVSDVDRRRADAVAGEVGGRTVAPDDVYETPCDVFAPCAVGAVLREETIGLLRCGVVAGSANNQLARPEDALTLHARDILYAPDYVVNGGGALAFGLVADGTRDEAALMSRMADVGQTLREIFAEARAAGETPVAAARKRVERTLARGPRTSG